RLLICQPFDEHERDDLALLLRQLRHRFLNRRRLDLALDHLYADALTRFLRREDRPVARTAAHFVHPGIPADPEHPALQLRIPIPLIRALERPFERDLHDVVGVVDVLRQRAGKTSQSRQERRKLGTNPDLWLAHALHPGRSDEELSSIEYEKTV